MTIPGQKRKARAKQPTTTPIKPTKTHQAGVACLAFYPANPFETNGILFIFVFPKEIPHGSLSIPTPFARRTRRGRSARGDTARPSHSTSWLVRGIYVLVVVLAIRTFFFAWLLLHYSLCRGSARQEQDSRDSEPNCGQW